MAQSWRIKTKEIDDTEKTTTSTPIIGASVIVSPKGPRNFIKFNRGDTQGVINTFGYPSAEYPTIQDALDIVSKCTMWLASPYKGGTYGGVFVTPKGTIPFNLGVQTKEFEDYSSIAFTDSIGIGDGLTTNFTFTIKDIDFYVGRSLSLSIDGIQHEIEIAVEDNIETITDLTASEQILASDCTLNTETGELTLNFINPIAQGSDVSIGYNMNLSSTLFVLFDKNMQEDDLKVKVNLSENEDNAFDISVYRFNPITSEYDEVANSPFTVGLSETSKNTYGDNIFIESVFNDNQQLFDAHVVNSVFTSFVNDTEAVNVKGGSRGDTPEGADIANVYNELKNTNKFKIKFCVDGTNKSEVISKFEDLRNNHQLRCRYLYCTADVSGNEIVDSPSTYNFGITANRGMYQYCLNWGIHKDIYQGNDFKCSNMGLIAGRLVDALNAGTGCPAWIDENGVGGILGSSITKLTQNDTSEDTLEELDNLNFNAVVNDYTYGPMIVGWRTRQVKKTVYSNIPQSSLADTVIEEIVDQVLPLRIGKLIDESSYSLVRNGCESILNTYTNFFEDFYVWCDSENNTPEMREKEELVVTVGVVFKNYARTVELTFRSFRAGTNVEETLKQ